jgi:hypothetical protein
MPTRAIRLAIVLVVLASAGPRAQAPAANHDETKVPAYTLPDPLVGAGGERVTREAWPARRQELLDLFAHEVYGRTPDGLPSLTATVIENGTPALGGLAVRRQVLLAPPGSPSGVGIHVLVYRPATATGRVPVFVSLNFRGNHAVAADPAIQLATTWLPDDDPGVVDHKATERARGSDAARWPLETIIGHGYALVTAYYGDIYPDFAEGHASSLVARVEHRGAGGHEKHAAAVPATDDRSPDAWGAIGAWAWGLSRILDYVATDPHLDARRAAVLGHSRLGKAALWAGVQDTRFAIVISNESGCGGAALSKRIFGETVEIINTSFPHWFALNFRKYNRHEADLPVDQHELLALVAPRPLYVASALEDQWADPRGEFLAAVHADPVYALLGVKGLGTRVMPPADRPVGDTVRYHVRSGPHDVRPYDWEQYLRFADGQWKRP